MSDSDEQKITRHIEMSKNRMRNRQAGVPFTRSAGTAVPPGREAFRELLKEGKRPTPSAGPAVPNRPQKSTTDTQQGRPDTGQNSSSDS